MKALALVLAMALVAPLAHADPEPRAITAVRVKDGDTLGVIAAEFYGDRRLGVLLLLENKLPPKPVRPGMRLRVPLAREIVTRPRDTLATLADQYLGDARRDQFLAKWNKIEQEQDLASGTPLFVPLVVTFTIAKNETLAQLAATYLGSAKDADLLRRYNFLDEGAVLEKGQQILIPAYTVHMQPTKLPPADEKALERGKARTEQQARASEAMPAARYAWRLGEYARVKELLEPLDLDYLELPVALEAATLFGSALVAFGKPKDAETAFRKVIDRKPTLKLRRFAVSPKVLDVWKQAGGELE